MEERSSQLLTQLSINKQLRVFNTITTINTTCRNITTPPGWDSSPPQGYL